MPLKTIPLQQDTIAMLLDIGPRTYVIFSNIGDAIVSITHAKRPNFGDAHYVLPRVDPVTGSVPHPLVIWDETEASMVWYGYAYDDDGDISMYYASKILEQPNEVRIKQPVDTTPWGIFRGLV